jgi:hypothetical protein
VQSNVDYIEMGTAFANLNQPATPTSKYIFRIRQLLELWETGAIPDPAAVIHWIRHHTNKGA